MINFYCGQKKKTKIEFSKLKTKYIVFSNGHLGNHPKQFIENIELERVNNYKQLGLFLDQNLNWETHVNYTIQKTQKIFHMFKLIRHKIDFKTSEKL